MPAMMPCNVSRHFCKLQPGFSATALLMKRVIAVSSRRFRPVKPNSSINTDEQSDESDPYRQAVTPKGATGFAIWPSRRRFVCIAPLKGALGL